MLTLLRTALCGVTEYWTSRGNERRTLELEIKGIGEIGVENFVLLS